MRHCTMPHTCLDVPCASIPLFPVAEIGAEPHVNACFKHFYFFTHEFNLVDDKEYEPLVRD